MQWYSNSRRLTKCGMFGIGAGWDKSDGTACLLIQVWKRTIVIGPHIVRS